MTAFLTAAEAIWLIPFVCGLIFLAAVAVERVARWLSRPSDYVGLVKSGRERGRGE